jgi:hypothetical protein
LAIPVRPPLRVTSTPWSAVAGGGAASVQRSWCQPISSLPNWPLLRPSSSMFETSRNPLKPSMSIGAW